MKILLSILAISLFTNLKGQELHPRDLKDFKTIVLGEYNYVYNNENCLNFYKQALRLLDLKNPDSCIKASKILWGLFLFDNQRFSFNKAKPFLKKINNYNKNYFDSIIIGRWRFSHDFNIGLVTEITTSTSSDTIKTIKLDGQFVKFYSNDSLIRVTKYFLKPIETTFQFTKYNKFNIYLVDKNETWGFDVEKNNEKNLKLTIHLDSKCQCGCRLDIYKKI